MTFEKYKKDGNVAVLVSPGYGAGWSTWGSDQAALAMDRDLVEALLEGGSSKLAEVALQKYPDEYQGGLGDVEIKWVPEGSRFEIREYDGNESLVVFGPGHGMLA